MSVRACMCVYMHMCVSACMCASVHACVCPKLKKLKKYILPTDGDATAADPDKNEEGFAELVQFLDDTSLGLVIRDARDDGKKALEILREHYAGSGKPRIISLYTQLRLHYKRNLRRSLPNI